MVRSGDIGKVLSIGVAAWAIIGVVGDGGTGGVGGTAARACAAAACPPSECELELRLYEVSGDGLVTLPPETRWEVRGKRRTTDALGRTRIDEHITVALVDAANKDHRPVSVRMPTMEARELRDALRLSVDQRKGRADQADEQPGLECVISAKACGMEKGGAAKIDQVYWQVTETAAAPCGDKAAAGPARLTLTFGTWQHDRRAVTVRMDAETARKLIAGLDDAIAGRNPEGKKSGSPAA